GLQVEAVDYLLKPITFGNLLKAANKVKAWVDLNAMSQPGSDDVKPDHLFVKSSYKLLRIELSAIKYLESQHEYVKIFLTNGKPVLTKMSLKTMEELLPTDQFMRVHRSYIVSTNKVVEIERSSIVFDSKVHVPVSKQYQGKFQGVFTKGNAKID
ncbi:MAG: LytTR family DNA-binding domain-containing protein, partial [Bacteroidia bacterium]|nr:LytTR family DNA-binding domain-containing protein [Bacteroidia bacterium]